MSVKKVSTRIRQEQITRAALEVISSEGVQGLTTANMARRAGISEANLYRHFENKEAILKDLVERVEKALVENVKRMASLPLPPLEKLERIFKLHVSHIEANRGIPRVIFSSEAFFVREIKEGLGEFISRYLGLLKDVLKEGVRDGSVRSDVRPEVLANMCISMIQFTVLRWMLSDYGFSLEKRAGVLWRSYSKMIGARR